MFRILLLATAAIPPLSDGAPITSPQPAEAIGLGHGAPARAGTPITLFMNFDGAELQSGCGNDSKNDCSRLAGQFDGAILPYEGNEAVRASIGQAVRSDVVDFGVQVTDQRPPQSEDYAMVLIGNSAAGGSTELGFAGVAPTIDCGDSNPNETSFALAVSFVGGGMATVILQEAAHTWGLEHTNVRGDNLFPTSGGVADPQFLDECMKVVEDTRLNPTDGVCNSVHTQFCEFGYQNSYQEMLWLFGEPIADMVAPTVTIDEPADGAMLAHPADFELVVTLADDRSPQLIDMKIFLDGGATPVYEEQYPLITLNFPVQGGLSAGEHTFRVEGVDESGNMASDEVRLIFGDAGPGTGDETGSDGGDPTTTSTTSTSSSGSTTADPSTSTSTGSSTTSSSGGSGDSASGEGGDPTETDGLPEDPEVSESGCGCRTPVTSPTAWLLLGPPLLLGRHARRRRRAQP